MKALLLTDYSQLEVTDVPVPEIGDRDVLVRVAACGICGSDVHGYDGSSGRRIPPLVMGHEAAGVVAATGGEVQGLEQGDRVTFDSMASCGRCGFCRRGQFNLCDDRRVLGVSCGEYRRHGAFAEFVAVPEQIVYKLPDEVSMEQAAMIEPLSVAVHAVARLPIELGDTALVVGTGMIGLLVIQVLRFAGCGRIVAADLADDRLELAQQVGADVTLNAATRDVPAEVAALTDGRGADVAVEAVGATAPLAAAVAAVRKGGAVALVGNIAPQVDLPLQSIVTREVTLYGSCASSGEYPQCIDLLARGAVQVDPLITAVAPLEEGAGWFTRLHAREAGVMKVLLKP